MGQRVKIFVNGSFLEYDRGRFDDWCVYLTRRNGDRRAFRDMDYFYHLKRLSAKYGASQIYQDYVRVYDLTGREVEERVLGEISRISSAYGQDVLKVDQLFSMLYLAMLSEERKKFTKLGKRIKRLGVHQLLVENWSVNKAANFTRDMCWQDIAALCRKGGF